MSAAKTVRSALLVYPRIPPSFWGGHYIFDVVGIKASMPPLGLLTVSAMFPEHYRVKVVDMNVELLTDEHVAWDHLVLGEGEEAFSTVLDDLERGCARRVYQATRPDVSKTPVPRFDLINPADYLRMAIQFSRGCPFDCEFCDITKLFGRVPSCIRPRLVPSCSQALESGSSGSIPGAVRRHCEIALAMTFRAPGDFGAIAAPSVTPPPYTPR